MKLPSKYRTIAIACLLAGVITLPCVAQQAAEVTEVEGITEYQLENGLQLLLFPDDSKPTFTINMTIGVGSRHEGYGETGMAHLLEHMLFKGTPTHRDIPKLLKDRGVINMNGTTWVDRTNYYETLPASDDNLEFAIRMEADRLVNSTILAEDLASEMTVVRNEFERGENSPISVLRQRMMSTAFEWHNYGKSTIGNRSDIERVPINNLRGFYERFYQPDNVMLVIAGKFDQEKALDWVQEYFGALPRPKTKRDSTWTEEPPQDGERIVILRRVGEVPAVGVLYHVPAASHPDFAAIQVLGSILSREPSGRLYKALVEPGIMTSVFAGAQPTHDPGALMALGQVGEGHTAEEARDVLINSLEDGSLATIDETEVKRAVEQLLKRREDLLADSSRLALELSEWYAYGDWRLFFLHRDRLEQVTPEKVREVATKYLQQSNRTVGMFIPSEDVQRVRVPNAAAIDTMVGNYQGREKIAAGESFEPTPAIIDERTIRGEFQSGIRYAMLPKETRGDRVVLSLQLHFGDEESLNGRVTATELLGDLMTKGTAEMTHEELKDYLDEKRINMSVSSGLGSLSVNVRTRREFLMDALDVMEQVLKQPVLPEDKFEIERKSRLTQLRASLPEPQMLAITKFMRMMSPYPADDVRYSPTIEENIQRMEALKLDDVRELYEQFIGGQHGEVAVVGDFDVEQVGDRLESMFTDWTSERPYTRIATSGQPDVTGERIDINTPDKKNAVYIAGLSNTMRDDDPDYEAMLIANYILGSGGLSSRLADRVRKKEGLSYTVMSQFNADSQDDRGMFLMFAISNPENTEKVVDTIDEEIQRLIDSGVTGDELQRAQASWLESREGNRADDSRLAGMLRQQLELGRTMQFVADREDKVRALAKEQVDTALRRVIEKDRLIIITAGDFDPSASADEDSDTDSGDD